MTTKQLDILNALKRNGQPMTPTQVGQACGKPYHSASSWASSGLKGLVADGLVKRHIDARYEVVK